MHLFTPLFHKDLSSIIRTIQAGYSIWQSVMIPGASHCIEVSSFTFHTTMDVWTFNRYLHLLIQSNRPHVYASYSIHITSSFYKPFWGASHPAQCGLALIDRLPCRLLPAYLALGCYCCWQGCIHKHCYWDNNTQLTSVLLINICNTLLTELGTLLILPYFVLHTVRQCHLSLQEQFERVLFSFCQICE